MNRAQILQAAQRLVRYAGQVQAHLKTLDRRQHMDALADLAETSEIARRLYNAVSESLKDGAG